MDRRLDELPGNMMARLIRGARFAALAWGLARLAAADAAYAQDAVTFTEDVAPIFAANCVACHRPDGIGPFSLLDYDAARRRAAQIAEATADRVMPPWKPVAPPGAFEGERRLSDSDIAAIGRWAAAGAPEGPPGALPAPPDAAGWQLGAPDLVVSMPEPYVLPAGESDVYRKFVLPVPTEEERWVRAVEIRPGPASPIHHATIRIDTTGRARDRDAEDPLPGYSGFMVETARFPPGHVLGWAPGRTVTEQSEELSWALAPGSDFVLQLHMLPGAAPVPAQPEVGLYFAAAPATVEPVSVILQSMTIDIPAGESAHAVRDAFRLPVALDLLAIYPHAHYLGREVRATATLPDGTERMLLRIDDWDFNWQDEYRYRTPVHLPAGTRVEMHYVYDNSAANPRNPHDPPRRVVFGPQSSDEMAQLLLQVVPAGTEDREALTNALRVKSARDEILGYQARLRRDPEDHESRTGLAVRYMEVGQVALAEQELREALRLAPDFPDAHYNLGSVLQAQGSVRQAIGSYRRAIAIDPTYSEAHNNLGALLDTTGDRANALAHYRLAVEFGPREAAAHYNLGLALMARRRADEPVTEAVEAFRQAVALDPGYADARASLGAALLVEGDPEAAIAQYEQAVALDPAAPRALVELAWLLATAPEGALRDVGRAIALAERARSLYGSTHPVVLDTLAAAYAGDGRFEEAIALAREAAARSSETAGFESRTAAINERLGYYLAHRPYRMTR
ncbi:MAG: tetratricopeptide repeat protein [Acidobacteria bacterium]|nr:tetratricopeptide repeat protein [Acidobacteriota bacterium]